MLNSHDPQQPLLSLRTAVILLLGVLTALGAGVLTVLADGSVASGILAGAAAFAAAVLFFHTILA
ncbi:hypothetical protein OHA09_36070 [Streptomyces longwoodensis]|uniref:hypothetical protein n=1 Tax=Streptomyces longwoodensis TaxID=68231 RepID=UPI002E81FE0D|nr:hypothetical protein [Streptomyces longwoodensis]WUC55749.1 hypothetical protein OHA09_00905 [Streptomyces longwoodensis]WUC62132.1 hypothetical protein OHA09_36070 [Streptomyces longwoodensis]